MASKCEEITATYNGEDLKYFTFPQKFDHKQSAVPGNPCYNFRFRIFVFFSYIVLTQLFQLFCTPTEEVTGIWDAGHALLKPINEMYQNHRWTSIMAQIASAVMLDIAYLYVSLYWVLYSRNFRLFAALIIFYVFRAIHLNIAKLEFPIDYYWEDPQIPSLVVKYGRFSDFFYSGHVGYLIICALEMKKIGKKVMAWFFFIGSLYQAFVVISFEIHYTMDVTTGCIFAHYFYNMVCYWEVKIDFILKIIADFFTFKKKKVNIEYQVQAEKIPATTV